ncbi:hypothetical protein OE88DRAFT_1661912 [Heliocybe sulcata]|uniref:Metallo-beta-lactamase domain-containing protein n=1 Tax=Heliocybe sulcata TaxID=5364 RepID=A0A5C3MXI7_9AGAM|nr:hypothetical protein OE88DRAFT_1661912 [Heliocybe sulcata]
MNGAGGTVEGVDDTRMQAGEEREPLEIHGPLGTRACIRNGLAYTHTILGSPYVVHEVRFPTDPATQDHTHLAAHSSEVPGRNIAQVDGVWPNIYEDSLVTVSVAPILHSVPCVRYVVTENPVPGKMDPREYIPHLKRTGTPGVDPDTKPGDSYESVEARTRSRGHSTPQMAGAFAMHIRARQLLLNHFSARYPGNDDVDDGARKTMEAIKALAAEKFTWEVVCTRDLRSVDAHPGNPGCHGRTLSLGRGQIGTSLPAWKQGYPYPPSMADITL